MSYPVSCNQNTELSWADNSHLTIIKKAQPDLKKLQKQRSLEFNVRTKAETGRKINKKKSNNIWLWSLIPKILLN